MLPRSAKQKVSAMKKLSPLNISLIAVIVIFIAGAATWYFYSESQKSGFVKGAEKTEKWGKDVVKDTKKLFTK